MGQEIETARLRLRLFTPDDLDDLALIYSDPDVVRYMGAGNPATREETATALASIIRHWRRNGFGRWAVVDKVTCRLIGYGGLRNLDGVPELVYLLAKSHWGFGLATEIGQACFRFGFRERGFESIVALVKSDNGASKRVLEKLGMNFERAANYFNYEVLKYSISLAQYQPQAPHHGHPPATRLPENISVPPPQQPYRHLRPDFQTIQP